MNDIYVNINNISKSYGNVKALDNITFSVEKGEIFGLIGPDGAGKSSLIRILTTLILPDLGNASIEGLDVVKDFKQLRRVIGYMPGTFSLYEDLSIVENLNFFATIFHTTISKNYHLIRDIYRQIEPFKNRRAGKLSGGMKQKLALSCALIHKPDILFLDEPTTGIDAVSRMELWQMLAQLKALGLTIIVSTPYMNEAGWCDRVALMQKGKIMRIETPKNIEDEFTKPIYAVKGEDFYKLLNKLRNMEITQSAYFFGTSIHLTTYERIDSQNLNDIIERETGEKTFTEEITANIEDCFMDKMSRNR
jgi:ABC-2 type transport system ATP-binding protein